MKAKKILIVDDMPNNLDALVTVIEKSDKDYEVYQALEGSMALKIAIGEQPDIIISDWEMPGMDGISLLKELKADERTSEIPVIMCTGIMTTSENLQTALEAGAVDYIRKPIDEIELTARVKSMIALSDSYKTIKAQNRLLQEQKQQITDEKEKSESLLLNILPKSVAEELKTHNRTSTALYQDVSILFTDFVSFTSISEKLSPQQLVAQLGEYFEAFDDIMTEFQLEKIKTNGDSYICAAGVPEASEDNAIRVVKAARKMLEVVRVSQERQVAAGLPVWNMRVGVHTGEVVAGVVGKKKFVFDIWGDTVNVSSRLESTSEGGKINISGSCYELIKDHFSCTYRGKVQAKNLREIDMYFVDGLIEN